MLCKTYQGNFIQVAVKKMFHVPFKINVSKRAYNTLLCKP